MPQLRPVQTPRTPRTQGTSPRRKGILPAWTLATSPYASPVVSRQQSGLLTKKFSIIGEAAEIERLKKEVQRLKAVIDEKDSLLFSANLRIQKLSGYSSRPMTEASAWRPMTRDALRPKAETKTQLGEYNAWGVLAERELNLVQSEIRVPRKGYY